MFDNCVYSMIYLHHISPDIKVCPGVCVAERISSHCEAALDVYGLCKSSLRCCVSHNIFDGKDSVPKEFVLIKGSPMKTNEINTAKNVDVSWCVIYFRITSYFNFSSQFISYSG